MSLSLRPAVLADIPALRAMLMETWHATYDATLGVDKVDAIAARWHSIEALTFELEEAEAAPAANALLVAMREGALVGSASASCAPGGPLELARLYIAPQSQRGGLGTALLRAILVRFSHARALRLEVEPRNASAIAFYRRHGLEVVARGSACGGDTKAAVEHLIMEAPLPLLPLRPAVDADAQDLFGLMALCFAEYPGCFVDPHDDMPDLVRPGHWKERVKEGVKLGGEFLVLEDERGRVCASVAVNFPQISGDKSPVAELHRLYVRPDCRKRGIAGALVARAEAMAKGQGATRMILWSDTRFIDAHRLYERFGYAKAARPRKLGDISQSMEYHFSKVF